VAKPARIYRKKQRVVQNVNLYGIDYERLIHSILQQLLMTALRVQTKANNEAEQNSDVLKRDESSSTKFIKMSKESFSEFHTKCRACIWETLSTVIVIMDLWNNNN
jgi:hypothetical protein